MKSLLPCGVIFRKFFIVFSLLLISSETAVKSYALEENRPQLDLQPLEARANEGVADAQTALGIFLIAGREVPKDEEKGVFWLQKASEQNDPRALYYYGLCFLDGIATKKDTRRGLELVQRAIDTGYVPAQMFLGKCYLEGKYGLKKDVKKALELLTTAAQAEDVEAQFLLGMLYSGSEESVPRKRNRSLKWLTLSAQHGYVPAQRVLGREYLETKNFFWAREWLEAASEAGDDEATHWLQILNTRENFSDELILEPDFD